MRCRAFMSEFLCVRVCVCVCVCVCVMPPVKQVREEPDVGVATAELTLVVEGLEGKTAALSKELEVERITHHQQVEGMTAEIAQLKETITKQSQEPKTGASADARLREFSQKQQALIEEMRASTVKAGEEKERMRRSASV